MEPALVVGSLWLLFGGTHVGLTVRPVRTRLVTRLGETGFLLLFWLVAAAGFSLLALGYGRVAGDGAVGPALGTVPGLRAALLTTLVLGLVLMASAFTTYERSPYASMLSGPRPWHVRGIERITRHPFFVGLALFATAHALLATRLAGTVFFAGFVLLATFGARHQDRKLLALRGEPYAAYLRETSAVPFVALGQRRQSLAWRELPLTAIVVGLVLAWLLRSAHATIAAHLSVFLIVVVVGGAAVLSIRSARADARRAGRVATAVGRQA